MNIIQRVRKLKAEYNETAIGAVCDFVLGHYSELHHYTTQAIADETGTSKSALVRFSQKLGYKGWKEFSADLIEQEKVYVQKFTDVDPNVPFSKDSGVRDIIYQLASLKVESILNTADLIEEEEIIKAVNLIREAQRVEIVGLAPNSPNLNYAKSFARRMLQIGKIVDVREETEKRILANALSEKDAVIAVSYNGAVKNHDTYEMMQILEEKKIPVIAVTGNFDSYLREHADVTLLVTSEENHYSKIATFATGTSMMLILDVLYACYFAHDYDVNSRKKGESDQNK